MLEGQIKRGRGRPRKYPQKPTSDFESTKYDSFFDDESRKPKNETTPININQIITNVFTSLYCGNFADKLFSKPKNEDDIPILANLKKSVPISNKLKTEKTCDDVFYEYLAYYKDKTNEQYFSLLIKFILLFRECYDLSKNKDKDNNSKQQVTDKITPEGLPDLCNEFYGEFLEPNCFFDIKEEERLEIIEIIQHFCIWLFKNDYTKSKLSLAS